MRVERVQAIPYALRFREPYVTARGRLERREIVLFRVCTDTDGLYGLGEGVPLTLRSGFTLPEVVADLERAAAVILDASEEELIDHQVAVRVRCLNNLETAPGRAAADQALADLFGRMAGEPVWRWLGADEARPVPCNATLSAGRPDAVAEAARQWAERGFKSFKLKLGIGPDDAEQVRAVREQLGEEARIRVDANGAWDEPTALARLAELSELGIELAEQPVAELEQMARVRERTSIPIAADESVPDRINAARAREAGACDLVSVKLSKVGGFEEAHAIAQELPAYLSSALDGPVGIAASAHAAQTLRGNRGDAGVAHGLATQLLFAETIASRQCELRGGLLHIPDGPGLGVEIDEEALEANLL